MDLLKLMNNAWEARTNYGAEDLQIFFKNLLSHSYVAINRIYQDNCIRNNKFPTNIVFEAYETIIIFLMKADGDFLQGEYDAYVKFAQYTGNQYYSADEIRSIPYNKNKLANCINYIKNYRFNIAPNEYESMVYGFCYLCLLGDKQIDEKEYYILRCFFDDAYDYCPSDWEAFKREW